MDATLLTIIDAALQTAGALIAIAFAVRVVRRGDWRNPLAHVRVPTSGPGLEVVGLAPLAYIVLQQLCLLALRNDGSQIGPPGSDSWHRAQSADAIARLITAGGVAWLLTRVTPQPAARAVRSGFARISIALFVFLALVPVCVSQLEFGSFVWDCFQPQRQNPQHDFLTAFPRSEWGVYGKIHLAAVAVIVAPVAEEIFFRGLLMPVIWRLSGLLWVAIVLSAGLFASVHSAQPQAVLPMFTFGVVLGCVRASSGLLPCLLIHALFNFRTILIAALCPELLQSGN